MSQLWRKSWVRTLSSRLGAPAAARKQPIRVRGERLGADLLEQLEDRVVPATTYSWTGASSTNWSDPGNWSVGVGYPQFPGDKAQFINPIGTPQAVTVDVPASVGE